MRVKIGDTWYEPTDEPICVELTEDDKKNIADMPVEGFKYAVYDEKMVSGEAILDWMRDRKTLTSPEESA